MNRFHVFISAHYYPDGFGDYKGSFPTYRQAELFAAQESDKRHDRTEIVWTDDNGNLTDEIPENVKETI